MTAAQPILVLLAAALAGQPPAAAPAEDAEAAQEIIVTGTRHGRCEVRLADRALSERQFEAHAGEWARLGRAVRVRVPPGSDRRCLTRIVFRLYDRGVRLVHFAD